MSSSKSAKWNTRTNKPNHRQQFSLDGHRPSIRPELASGLIGANGISYRHRLSQKTVMVLGYGRRAVADVGIAAAVKASNSLDTISAAKMRAFVEVK